LKSTWLTLSGSKKFHWAELEAKAERNNQDLADAGCNWYLFLLIYTVYRKKALVNSSNQYQKNLPARTDRFKAASLGACPFSQQLFQNLAISLLPTSKYHHSPFVLTKCV
jgi:hypothetical protein